MIQNRFAVKKKPEKFLDSSIGVNELAENLKPQTESDSWFRRRLEIQRQAENFFGDAV